jgi:hypothetical protein
LAARRYVEGKSQQEIASEAGVSQKTISLDLKVVHQSWLDDTKRDYADRQAAELQRLAMIEQDAREKYAETKDIKALEVQRKVIETRLRMFGLYQTDAVNIAVLNQQQVGHQIDWDGPRRRPTDVEEIEAKIHSVSDEMYLEWLQSEMDKTRARLAMHPEELRRQQREQLRKQQPGIPEIVDAPAIPLQLGEPKCTSMPLRP